MSHHRAIPRSVSGGPSQQFTSTIGPSHPNSSDPLVPPTRALKQLRFTEYEAGSVNGIREETLLAAISCKQTPDTENAKGVILFKGYIVPGKKFKQMDEEEGTAEEKTKAEEKAKADEDVLRSYIDGINTAASCVTFYNSMIDEAVNLEQTEFDPNSNKNPPTMRAATGAVSSLRIIHKNLSGISRPNRALQFNAVHDGWKQRCDQGVADPSQHPGSRSTKNPELHRLSQDSNIEQTVQILSHPSFKPPPTRHDVAFLNFDGTQITIQKGTKIDSLKSDQSTADKTSAGKRTVDDVPPSQPKGKRRQGSANTQTDEARQSPTATRQLSYIPSQHCPSIQRPQAATSYDNRDTRATPLRPVQHHDNLPGQSQPASTLSEQPAATHPDLYGTPPVWPSYSGNRVPPDYGDHYFAEPDSTIPQPQNVWQGNSTQLPSTVYPAASLNLRPQAHGSHHQDGSFDAMSGLPYTHPQPSLGQALQQNQGFAPSYPSAVHSTLQSREVAIDGSILQSSSPLSQPMPGAPASLDALRPYLLYPNGNENANMLLPGEKPKGHRGPMGEKGR